MTSSSVAAVAPTPRPFNLFLHVRDEGKTTRQLYAYPLPTHVINSRYKDINKFIFPEAGPATDLDVLTYTFVLTDDSGQRQYCHTTRTVTNEAFCIVSCFPWCNFFNRMVHAYRANGPESGQIMLKTLYSSAVPPAGEPFPVMVAGVRPLRPQDNICPLIDSSPVDLLTMFSLELLLRFLAAIALERHIAVVGPNFHVVSTTIMSALSMINPIEWHHTLIPVLPRQLTEVLASPTPYIVGLLTSQLPHLENVSIESVVLVRLGPTGTCESVSYLEYDEIALPRSGITSKLRMQLAMLKQTPTTTPRDVCEVFTHYFAEGIGVMLCRQSSPATLATAADGSAAAGVVKAAAAGHTILDRGLSNCDAADRKFFSAFSETAGLRTLEESFNASLVNGSWKDVPFALKCVKLHKRHFPTYWASISAAAASPGAASPSTALGSAKGLAAAQGKSHNLGSLLCRRLGSWCGTADDFDDKTQIYSAA